MIRKQKPRGIRNPRVNKQRPAYLVISRWESLSEFCRHTGYTTSTVYDWLLKGLIPADYQEHILKVARKRAVPLPPELFVPGVSHG